MDDFYDQLAPLYHLIYPDWDAAITRQGEELSKILQAEWPGCHRVLDVACGIGTQSIALAFKGYAVTGSDLSVAEVDRAKREALFRGAQIYFSVCDMRQANASGNGFDVVLCADNSIAHLLGDDQILQALKQMHNCLKQGGGCLITTRDYDAEPRGINIAKPCGVRLMGSKRYVLVQVWDFDADQYDLTFLFVEEDLKTGRVETHALRSRCYAISTNRLCELMREAGFDRVRRMDGVFFQPVFIGTKAL